jgi:hypothetical protein
MINQLHQEAKKKVLVTTLWLIIPIIFLFTLKNIPLEIQVSSGYSPTGGPGCPEGSYSDVFYDINGNKIVSIEENNNLIPPIFHKVPISVPKATPPPGPGIWTDNCYIFPDQIDPEIAVQGQPTYPVILSATINDTHIKTGESIALSVTATILDEYTSDRPGNLLDISTDQPRELAFELDAPNFDFSPENEKPRSILITIEEPAVNTWIIAPKEKALGPQLLHVVVTDANTNNWLFPLLSIGLEVRSPIGIHPQSLSILIAIGSVVLWIVNVVKPLYEIFRNTNSTKKKRKHKKRKPSK